MEREEFTYADRKLMEQLIVRLIDTGEQFAVSPTPQDLNAKRTGWCVSYPQRKPEVTAA